MGFLIDTCIWVAVERGALAPLDVALFTGTEAVYILPVTIAELKFGTENTSDLNIRQKRQAALYRLKRKPILRIDETTGEIFGSLAAQVENSARLASSIAAVVDAAASVANSSISPGVARGDASQQAANVVTQQLVAVTLAAQSGDAAKAEQAARASAAAVQTAIMRAIAADVAAGGDIAVIIGNAVAAGMTVAAAVEAIVAAGADPGRVTYLAITANYSAVDVVNGAADAGVGDQTGKPHQTLKINPDRLSRSE